MQIKSIVSAAVVGLATQVSAQYIYTLASSIDAAKVPIPPSSSHSLLLSPLASSH